MWPYIALTCSITVLPFCFNEKKTRGVQPHKRITCVISFLFLLLVMGLRNESMGMYDTQYVYHPIFNRILVTNIADLSQVVNLQQGVLMYYIMKIFQLFSKNYNQWIFFSSVPFLAAYAWFVNKRCDNAVECMFSFIFLVFIRIYTTGFYLQRHFFAMTFFLLAYDAIVEKKYKKYVLFSALAFLTHPTAVVVAFLYPISKFKFSGKQGILFAFAYLCTVFLGRKIFNSVFTYLSTSEYSYYVHYSSSSGFGQNTFGIVLTLLLLLFYIIIKLFHVYDDQVSQAFTFFAVATILAMGASIVTEMYRISYFFLVCAIPGYSKAIGLIKKSGNRRICFCTIYTLLCVYFWPIIMDTQANLSPYISMFE